MSCIPFHSVTHSAFFDHAAGGLLARTDGVPAAGPPFRHPLCCLRAVFLATFSLHLLPPALFPLHLYHVLYLYVIGMRTIDPEGRRVRTRAGSSMENGVDADGRVRERSEQDFETLSARRMVRKCGQTRTIVGLSSRRVHKQCPINTLS